MGDMFWLACAPDGHLLAPVQAEVDEVERLLSNFQQIALALTSSIYSQWCYHRRATIFSFHPFLRSQPTTNCFFRKTQDNASVLKKHFEPLSSGCLGEINSPECKPRDEVKDPRTDPSVAHRLDRFCIACSIVRVGPRIMELVMSLLDGHLERYVGHRVFLELQPVFGSNQTAIFL